MKLFPWIVAGWDSMLAESVVLRGPRRRGQPLSRDAAASALDDALRQEGQLMHLPKFQTVTTYVLDRMRSS